MSLKLGLRNKIRRSRAGGFTGLLDQPFASGATAAYSVRLLLAAREKDPIVQVRRDSDDDEAGVLPDTSLKEPAITLNSPITDPDNSFSDFSTLADFLNHNGGSPYNGLTSIWKDGSNNGNDASNSTAAEQPKLYDSSNGLVKENGKPALEFNNDQYIFKNRMNGALVEYFDVMYQNEGGTVFQRHILFSNRYSNKNYFVGVSEKGKPGSGIDSNVGTPTHEVLKGANPITRGDYYTALEDTQNLINIYDISNLASGFDFGISSYNTAGWYLKGKKQEIICYPSNRSSTNRSSIKSAIDNYYGIT